MNDPARADRSSGTHATRTAWSQVFFGAALMIATMPGRTQGLGLVTEPLLADLRLERMQYANINLWATLLGSLACIPAGWALDRLGLRRVTGAVLLALALAVWSLGALEAGLLSLFFWLLLSRALGQSALSVCSIAAVTRWFPRGAGTAMGLYSVLVSVGFALAFGIVGQAVSAHGWRTAWTGIAAALVVVATPIALLGLRPPPASPASEATLYPLSGYTLAEALRTGSFWLFACTAAVFNLVSSGLGLFNEAVLAERGFDQRAFHHFLVAASLVSLGGQLFGGWMLRRSSHQTLALVALLLHAASLLGVARMGAPWHLWAVAAVFGLSGGMIMVLFFSVWSDLFGQRHLGRIQGVAQMVTVLASALGPVLFAWCASSFGSYAPLLLGFAAAIVPLALLLRGTRQQARPSGSR